MRSPSPFRRLKLRPPRRPKPSRRRPRRPPLRCGPWRQLRRPPRPVSSSSRSRRDGAGALVARGSAEPNSDVRLYLNGAAIADAKPKSDGRWSLTIRRGMAPGAYAVHAEEVNPAGATVVASAEIRFDYPAAPASAGAINAANPPATPQSSGPSSADVVLELDPDRAGRVRPHAMGAQPKLLWRPDALPPDLRGQQGGDPQPEPHLSRAGLRRSEVRGETLSGGKAGVPSNRMCGSFRRHATAARCCL